MGSSNTFHTFQKEYIVYKTSRDMCDDFQHVTKSSPEYAPMRDKVIKCEYFCFVQFTKEVYVCARVQCIRISNGK